jgi:hypothetical protein
MLALKAGALRREAHATADCLAGLLHMVLSHVRNHEIFVWCCRW